MIKLGFLVLLLTLNACEFNEKATTKLDSNGVDLSQAIKKGDDLFYVLIGKDADNCTMYRIYSSSKATIQTILYQNSANKFSTIKNKQTCL